MSYLVDYVPTSIALVESVRAVDDDAVQIADVLVRVDNTLRHDDDLWIVFAGDDRLYLPVRRRIGTIVPHSQFEI